MTRGRPRGWALCLALLLAPVDAHAEPYARLLRVLERDPAYKVRMQAVRVLMKRLEAAPEPAPAGVLDALGRTATRDDSYLVRGMACVALGRVADPRGRPALEAAQADPEAFVRAQADAALTALAARAAPLPAAAAVTVVLDTAPIEGGAAVAELQQSLREAMARALGDRPGVRVSTDAAAAGHRLVGSIARLDARPDGEERVAASLEVRLTVATSPGNHLRHVMTAKARATAPRARLASVRRQLLFAAVDKAVDDALRAIEGEVRR